jgi:hypothetical protein
MNNDSVLNISRPFGPSLGLANMPTSIINKINNFIDEEIINEKKRIDELDAGKDLVGQVTQEIKLPNEIIEGELFDFLYKATKAYIKLSINKEISNFELLNTWIVRQFENEYNPIHFHSGHISGAGYLKLPENFGLTKQKNKFNHHGSINFIHGSKQFLSSGYVSQKPKVGDFYFFPHYLYHSVNPFYGDGERRSISFNARIDEAIYKVYGQDT